MFKTLPPPRPYLTASALLLAGLTSLTLPANGQSIGVEFGLAGVENYDPQPGMGASLFLPVFGRLYTSFSYTQWPGRDGNSSSSGPATGFGNRGFKFLAHYRLIGSDGFSISMGGGLGLFELLRLTNSGNESIYEDVLIGSVLFRKPVTPTLAPYARIDLHVPADGLRLNWGFLLAGLEIKLKR